MIFLFEKSGEIEVLAFDPASVMMDLDNPELEKLSAEVREKLTKVLESLN